MKKELNVLAAFKLGAEKCFAGGPGNDEPF
jgi:hypothetical protein